MRNKVFVPAYSIINGRKTTGKNTAHLPFISLEKYRTNSNEHIFRQTSITHH